MAKDIEIDWSKLDAEDTAPAIDIPDQRRMDEQTPVDPSAPLAEGAFSVGMDRALAGSRGYSQEEFMRDLANRYGEENLQYRDGQFFVNGRPLRDPSRWDVADLGEAAGWAVPNIAAPMAADALVGVATGGAGTAARWAARGADALASAAAEYQTTPGAGALDVGLAGAAPLTLGPVLGAAGRAGKKLVPFGPGRRAAVRDAAHRAVKGIESLTPGETEALRQLKKLNDSKALERELGMTPSIADATDSSYLRGQLKQAENRPEGDVYSARRAKIDQALKGLIGRELAAVNLGLSPQDLGRGIVRKLKMMRETYANEAQQLYKQLDVGGHDVYKPLPQVSYSVDQALKKVGDEFSDPVAREVFDRWVKEEINPLKTKTIHNIQSLRAVMKKMNGAIYGSQELSGISPKALESAFSTIERDMHKALEDAVNQYPGEAGEILKRANTAYAKSFKPLDEHKQLVLSNLLGVAPSQLKRIDVEDPDALKRWTANTFAKEVADGNPDQVKKALGVLEELDPKLKEAAVQGVFNKFLAVAPEDNMASWARRFGNVEGKLRAALPDYSMGMLKRVKDLADAMNNKNVISPQISLGRQGLIGPARVAANFWDAYNPFKLQPGQLARIAHDPETARIYKDALEDIIWNQAGNRGKNLRTRAMEAFSKTRVAQSLARQAMDAGVDTIRGLDPLPEDIAERLEGDIKIEGFFVPGNEAYTPGEKVNRRPGTEGAQPIELDFSKL